MVDIWWTYARHTVDARWTRMDTPKKWWKKKRSVRNAWPFGVYAFETLRKNTCHMSIGNLFFFLPPLLDTLDMGLFFYI